MKLSKKNQLKITGLIVVLLLAGVIFFFTYYQVDEVQVMGSSHYSEKQIKKMVLRGPMASNSILAPIIYTKKNTKDVPFVEGYTVTRLNRHTICVSVKEKDIVGCIPYLDSYIYFDRNGTFIESATERNEKIPFFDGIKVKHVIYNEELPIKDKMVMNTAVALSTIFQKNDKIPDHIEFSDDGQISLLYGDITVKLGKDEYLEDKMTRVLAILPLISDKKGILHAENVNDNSKMITLEQEKDETSDSSETWTGGYDEEGNYTGEGEYDENGNYVGAKPQTDLEYALSKWVGGYDEEGDYTGTGEYDADMNYVGPAPTEESMAANGSWTGGYREDGSYDGVGEYDRDGNYVGSVEEAQNSDEADSSGASEDGGTSGNEGNSDSTDTGDSGEQSYDTGDTDDYSGEETDSGYSDEADSYSDNGDYTSDSEWE
ncbi:cell division septal protein [Blautia schinkii]|uniref:cell division septal protein n=1 Tax=Blautia schinkii TaxID=180164 RepID=UPI001570DE45|nr:cell division septal protein [Blautia schinkii]NSK36040.1 cell division septal protein [Blautia schinkii]NSK66581.1 cell division septal protein [Blautia schinkii]